jgi:DNA transposition AAA+ family ATPase
MTRQEQLKSELRSAQRDGTTFAQVAIGCGMSRTAVSQFVNSGMKLRDDQMDAIQRFLDGIDRSAADNTDATPAYKNAIEWYETNEYKNMIGWLEEIRMQRKIGVMIGYPGCGKTTTIKRYAERQSISVQLIDCWPSMRLGDLLAEIAAAAGATVHGNNYVKSQQVVKALTERQDVMLIFDECENLRGTGEDNKKLETIRKIWDSTHTPIVMTGTQIFQDMILSGKGGLAHIYRRNWTYPCQGITENEARAIVRQYNVTPEAADMLVKYALDVRHGGMGNFVELLEISLKAARGGLINVEIVKDARRYKMLY